MTDSTFSGDFDALRTSAGTSQLVSQSNLDALEAGVTAALNRVEALLELEAYAETLPIIGSQLQNNANLQATVQTVTKLRDTIVNAIDQVSNLAGLAAMTAAQVQSELQSSINAALTSLNNMGLGFVSSANVTVNGDGTIAITFDTGRTSTATFHADDLGMSGLGLDMSGDATAALSYNFDFKVGIDGSGFYLDTAASNLSLGAKVSLNNLTAETNLGFLHFVASNITDSDPAAGADTLNLNLTTQWASSGLVRNFTGDILDVRASGDVDLDVHLAADMGDAALPSISADLHVDWGFSQNLLNGSGANSWNAATVTFDNVAYDFGSFVEQFITPILEQLDPILGPINEALAVLRTDISGLLLPEWAEMLDIVEPDRDEVTVLDFLQLASNTGNLGINFAPLAQLIDLVDTIVDTVEFFRGRTFDDAGYNVGSYQTQLQQIQGAVDTLSNININSGTFTSVAANIGTFLGGLSALDGFGDLHAGETHDGESGASIVGALIDNPLLNFSLIEDPINIIRMLLGQDTYLFTLDMQPINIGMGMDNLGNITSPITAIVLPIWPLPVVTANLNVAFQAVIDLAFGYDTTGLRDFAQGGFNDPLSILNGFYLDDQRSGGTDIPEIVLRAAIEIAIDANFAVVSVGGAGNVIGEISLDFADSLFGADGRLYVNEITGDLLTNPFQVFDVEGRISAGLRFYVNSVLGNLVNWNSSRLTLADFSFVQGAEDLGPPPGLGDYFTSDGSLWINVGNRAGERDIADHSDTGEFVEITSAPGGKVVVSGFGTAELFGDEGAIVSIQVDANAGNDDIRIADSVLIAARITGGAGVDSLTGGGAADQIFGGTQDDWLQGQGGNDLLEGEDGNDYLEGGAGADQLHGGNGLDTATYAGADDGVVLNFTTGTNEGDAAGDSYASIEIYEGSRHDDTMIGGAGADIFTAIEGDDTLQGMGGDDILAGGSGTNSLDGGTGYDIVNYFNANSAVSVTMIDLAGTTTGGTGGGALGDTLANVEQVDGSRFNDTLTGGAGRQVFVGAEGNDTLNGGLGDDVLVGSDGGDSLTGGEGIDTASYINALAGVTMNLATGGAGGEAAGDSFATIENVRGSAYDDGLTGDGQGNFIYAGAGNDSLNGGTGDDVLEGAEGGDSLTGGDGYDIASYLNAAAAISIDLINNTRAGVATGDSFSTIEVYQGSGHGDFIRGSNSGEEIRGESGDDTLHGAGGNDIMAGGVGIDTINGDAGVDNIHGNDGGDTINGGTEGDLVWGDAGADTLWGDAGGDVLQGGSDADTLNGGADGDVLWGDAGIDLLNGDDGNDEIHGGIEADTLNGGTGIDTLFGDEGADTIDGGSENDSLYGGTESDTLDGGANDDLVDGQQANDTLRGAAGADVLRGGQGSDSIDGGTERDRVTYADSTAGILLNLSMVTRTMGSTSVAALTALDGFGGTDTFLAASGVSTVEDATGSEFGDQIVGSEGGSRLYGLGGNDILSGLQGADLVEGGAGADKLNGGDSDDVLNGGTGADTLNGGNGTQDMATYQADVGGGVTASLLAGIATDGSGATDTLVGLEQLRGSNQNDTLTGNTGINRLEGLAGNDVLDGGVGTDTMVGGTGDDIHYVDINGQGASDDVVIELGGEGDDLIRASVDYVTALAANVEDLQLLGSVALGMGNGLANRLIGNNAANVFDGLAGGDTFWGYGGNDSYYFESWGDTVGLGSAPRSPIAGNGEVSGGGTDTIMLATANLANPNASATYSLDTSWAQWVENLTLLDDDRHIDTVGNARDNVIIGNAHYEVMHGGEGNDRLDPGDGGGQVFGDGGDDTLVIGWGDKNVAVANYYAPTGDLANGWGGSFAMTYVGVYLDYSSIRNFDITTGSANDSIVTKDGDDVVVLNTGDDYTDIGAGTDHADGGAGTDGVSANLGAEGGNIVWNLQTNVFTGSADSFANFEYFGTVTTGTGNDTIVTTNVAADEDVFGGDGNDSVTFVNRSDDFWGGAGLDTLVLDWSAVDASVANYYTAGADAEGGWTGSFAITYYGWYDNYDSVERFVITSGSAGDSIRTKDGNDIVKTQGGDDFVNVENGTDDADGGTGTDGISADLSGESTNIAWNLQTNVFAGTADAFTNFEYFGTVSGGSGNDAFVTTNVAADEDVFGGGGNDTATFLNRSDDFWGGAGLDTLVLDWSTVDASVANYYTAGADDEGGWTGSFAITYYGWYDNYDSVERFVITSGSAGDSIRTKDGNDIVKTQGGDDAVNVENGTDQADGGDGIDAISADLGAETGNILWNLQTNSFAGSADSFTNFEYFGTVTTGSGHDQIVTNAITRNELLYTGLGNDLVTFAGGSDEAYLGVGTDTLIIDWSYLDTGVGNYGGIAGDGDGGWTGTFWNSWNGWYTSYHSAERFRITTGSGSDNIHTKDGNDIVKTGAGDDFVDVENGTDQGDGGDGVDGISADLSAEAGNIVWNLTANSFAGSADSFTNFEYFGTISTGIGSDVIVTNNLYANETVNTGAGNDSATFKNGSDTFNAGIGTDTLVLDWSALTTSAANYGGFYDAADGGYGGTFWNSWNGWYTGYNSVERFVITTGSGNDSIQTRTGNDIVKTGSGDDFVNVENGTDNADGGDGVDGVSADLSIETGNIVWNLQTNVFNGSADSFANFEYFGTIWTGSGNDAITTTDVGAAETVNSGAGNDTATFRWGGDSFSAGTGTDTLVIDWGGLTSSVGNYGGIYDAAEGGFGGTFWNSYNGWYLGYNSVERFVITTGSANDSIATRTGNDVIKTQAGDDYVDVGSGTDQADGGGGYDGLSADLSAEAGNIVWNLQANSFTGSADSFTNFEYFGTIATGGGADAIVTTTANAGETIHSGAGNDTVTVRAGSDTVYAGTGSDTLILDFSAESTSISNYGGVYADGNGGWGGTFWNSYNGWYFSYSSIEKFVFRGGSAGDSIATQDGADTLEGNGGNDYLAGGAGNDTIDGGTGDDTMVGGLGNDSFTLDSAGDVVSEAAGEGTDTARTAITLGVALADNVENLLLIGSDAIDGLGNASANALTGNAAANTLDGGAGADAMTGGGGNDIYVVDNAGDTTIEAANGGTDLVRSTVGWTLAAEVENLTLTGAAAINGTGNALANTILGNGAANNLRGFAGNDRLDGGLGADTMQGGLGDDVIIVDNAGDKAVENDGEGTDTVEASVSFSLAGQYAEILRLTGANAINATGNTLANTLYGNGAANILNGGTGADRMEGGAGDDSYVVDDIGDVVVEGASAGMDLVQSSVSHVLAANVEWLTLTGAAAINGTGNGLANRITGNAAANILIGNAGDDILDGAGGVDRLEGGLGNDLFIVDNAGDVVIELAGAGSDTIESSASYAIAAGQYVETLRLTGAAAINGTGNAFSNTLVGNGGDNILNGGGGIDTMTGGLGNDGYFVDHKDDNVVEAAGEGTDTVNAALDYTLGDNVENLVLIGAAIKGIGNALANTITGNANANLLFGGAGADAMAGGLGNDAYFVDDAGDIVTEAAGEGTDTVNSSVTFILGANLEGLVLTGAGAINGTGNGQGNTITGNGANNVIDGGAGTDVMKGGAGNDTYYVDHKNDKVEEAGGGGTDTVYASVDYSVADTNVENLILTGAAVKATGNGLNNTLTGNAAGNVLIGGSGADTMIGGLGSDTYYVDNVGDVVTEAAGEGSDTVRSVIGYTLGANLEGLVLGGTETINGTGNALANSVVGNAANNVIDGGAGADTLKGGAGNDTYVVDDAGDKVFELDGEGTDTVQAWTSFAIGTQFIETVRLMGSANINATGNGLANTLLGNAGNNILNGGAGADAMIGGAGDDRYVVDNAGDTITELSSEGNDLVEASVTFSLGIQHLEALTLTGAAAIDGTGNSLANTLTGNAATNVLNGGGGDDQLHGMLGADTLTGGNGLDSFWFETALGATNVDSITDFKAADDSIYLDRSIFAGIAADGALAAGAFRLGATAVDADDRILYDKVSGSLYYDADGMGGVAAVLFAQVVAGTAMTAADFFAVA